MSDFLPYVKWLYLQAYLRYMKSNAEKLDKIASDWLQEHLHKKRDEVIKQERDFMDAILSLFCDNIDASIYMFFHPLPF